MVRSSQSSHRHRGCSTRARGKSLAGIATTGGTAAGKTRARGKSLTGIATTGGTAAGKTVVGAKIRHMRHRALTKLRIVRTKMTCMFREGLGLTVGALKKL